MDSLPPAVHWERAVDPQIGTWPPVYLYTAGQYHAKCCLEARFGSCALLSWHSCAALNGGAVLLGICWEPSAMLFRAWSALLGK